MSNRKNVLPCVKILNAVDCTTTPTSPITNIQYLDNVCVEFAWTGTAKGTFYIDGSVSGNNWKAITLDPAIAPAGSAGNDLADLNQLSFPLIRIRYIPDGSTPGTGTVSAWIGGKEV